ncbi:hypothetical protein BC962_1169 [Gillisia mitskevichiae]|uniref:SpoIIAA-like protein n=1 Tax=Gillisia mitskevichiae TaxID=270921 RepID=A0A495PT71_9FLAO|nr:hypothetical protein BC962_1169 [Gillisia mitskevichiae]
MKEPIKSVDLEFTSLEFYNNYAVSVVKEDTVFSQSQFMTIAEACSDFYNGKKFVYISSRKNNYNVNPTVYVKLEEIRKNLIGIAIVSDKVASLKMAEFERNFSKAEFKIFLELDEAVEWANDLIKKVGR